MPIEQEAGWAPEVVGRLGPAGNRTSDRPALGLFTISTMLSRLLRWREMQNNKNEK